ncbi:MAG TPA: hypothetical protein PK992_14815 [Planctomycetaceae bacterium]|nr:hypothetical protein [Planctomycetaceae bacterium]
MDPQATWNELQDAIRCSDMEITRDRAESLLGWLARGGFPPVTSNDPTMDQDAHRTAAKECCLKVLRATK